MLANHPLKPHSFRVFLPPRSSNVAQNKPQLKHSQRQDAAIVIAKAAGVEFKLMTEDNLA